MLEKFLYRVAAHQTDRVWTESATVRRDHQIVVVACIFYEGMTLNFRLPIEHSARRS